VRGVVLHMTAAAARVPLAIGFTALGAGVVVGRGLFDLLSRLLPFLGVGGSTPRHHAGRIRERARAAGQAARASGLLSRRDR
jgi:hypothetical protein